MPRRKFKTREEIVRLHNKKMESLNYKFLSFEISGESYKAKRAALDKALAKKLKV